MCDPLSTSARMAGGGFAMASPYGCGESSKKGSLHGVIEKLPFIEGESRISSRYGESRGSDVHAGVDLVPLNTDGTVNTNAYAISGTAGTLIPIDKASPTFGNFVLVKTNGGDYVFYAHLDSIAAKIPTNISVGTRLGIIGNTGRSTGLHLHVEIRQGGFDLGSPRLSPGARYE